MYSQAALELYPDLLAFAHERAKLAGAVREKLAGPFGAGGVRGALRGLFSGAARAESKKLEANAVSRVVNLGKKAVKPGTIMDPAARRAEASALIKGRAKDPARIARMMDTQRLSPAGIEHLGLQQSAETNRHGVKLFNKLDQAGKAQAQAALTGREAGRGASIAKAQQNAAAPGGPGMGFGTKAMIGLGLAGTGAGAYGIGQHLQKEKDKTTRNLAFGAGAAAGLAGPYLMRNAGSILGGVAQSGFNPFGG